MIIDRIGNLVHEFVYSGDDVVIKFTRNVLHFEEILVNTTKFNRYVEFTTTDQENHKKSTVCYICNNNRGLKGKEGKVFSDYDPKVRDHDHLTGR